MSVSLSSLHRYPIKSCRGESVTDAVVEPWGLGGDRRWMVVDDAGSGITAREVNALVLLQPELTATGLVLRAPGRDPIEVARPDPAVQVPVNLWSSHLTAAPTDHEVSRWLREVLGVGVRLVWLDDPTRRATDPTYSDPADRVSFADGYPLLLATEESLAALNDEVLAAAPHGREPLAMSRFRPNLVVTGAPAWVEDDWRRVRVGEAVFRAVKGCARCVITTIDPETAERGKEPTATLARVRRWGSGVFFGINLVPDTPGATVRVGDEVEVLAAAEPGGGPVRAARP
jgi:uncharacterized protein